MNTPLVSVVTPVYNTGEYLEEAIRSVLAQSYSNIEYIICNNHSTDSSGEIAARYSSLDSRIRVIQPPRFLPQAENFNFALQQISPESRYCKMLLADDWMFPRCLEEMVACAELSPSVGVVSAYRLIETEGDGFGLPVDKRTIPGRVAGRLHMLGGVYVFGTPSTVMYASDVVRARAPHFFPEDRFYFDTDAVFQILADRDLAFVHQILTFSRYQPGSITHNVSTFHSRAVDRLLSLHHYGRIFLNAEEFERAMARAWRVYYESLGQQWLRERFSGRSEKYWEFHQKRLAGIGMKIEPKRLALGAGTSLLRALTSSGDFLRDFVVKRRPVEEPWKVHSTG
jgi:glycosyltransferase involved in cell wall biosynthesis